MTDTDTLTPPTFPPRPPWSGIGADGWDGTQCPDDIKLVSASSVPKALSAPALERWHINETIDRLLNQIPKLNAMLAEAPREQVADWIGGLRYEAKEGVELSNADSGTLMHALLESWLKGEPVDERSRAQVDRDPVLTAMAGNLWAWFCRYDPEPVAMEQVVYDPANGIAGRFDAICRFRKAPELGTLLIDLKNAREARYPSGGLKPVYGDSHALQLACYRYATHVATFEPRLLVTQRKQSNRTYLVNRAELDACAPMYEVDGTAIIHNNPERCALYPIDTGPGVHRRALEAAGLHRWLHEESRNVVGPPHAPLVDLPDL